MVTKLVGCLGLPDLRIEPLPAKGSCFEQGVAWRLSDQQTDLWVGNGGVLASRYARPPCLAAELRWSVLTEYLDKRRAQCLPISYRAVGQTPELRRDLSLVIDKGITYTQLQQSLKSLKLKRLKEVRLESIYEGPPLDAQKKSYALSFLFQAESTSIETLVAADMHALVQHFNKTLGATLREK